MRTPFNWTCRFCGRQQTAVDSTYGNTDHRLINTRQTRYGPLALGTEYTTCANPDCKELTITVSLISNEDGRAGFEFYSWPLLPQSDEIPQPDCIPEAIREDYYEACRIRDLSPKASATLARRCLQGMIRDFCGIARARLIEEIRELRKQVDNGAAPRGVSHDTMEAIDHVRSLGNIGAHMEKDIDLIIDIDPDEAQTLIRLIELLFEDWYIAREDRRIRLERLGAVAADKKAITEQKKLPRPEQAVPTHYPNLPPD